MKRTDINQIGWIYASYVKYDPDDKKDLHEIAEEVILGKWGNSPDRQNALEAAGYASGDSISCKSTSAWPDYTIKFTYKNGNLDFSYEGEIFANYMKTGAVKSK
jgi:hypothetical protein